MENWQICCQFKLAHKLKGTSNVLDGNEIGETEMEVLFCKKAWKNQETVGYVRDRDLRWKAKKEGITVTEIRKH